MRLRRADLPGAEQPGGVPAHADRAPARGGGHPRATARSRRRPSGPRPTASVDGAPGRRDAPSRTSCEATAKPRATGSWRTPSDRDPDFFAFYRSMQAYETAMKASDTRMRPDARDSEFFRYFGNPTRRPKDRGRLAAAACRPAPPGRPTAAAARAGRGEAPDPPLGRTVAWPLRPEIRRRRPLPTQDRETPGDAE